MYSCFPYILFEVELRLESEWKWDKREERQFLNQSIISSCWNSQLHGKSLFIFSALRNSSNDRETGDGIQQTRRCQPRNLINFSLMSIHKKKENQGRWILSLYVFISVLETSKGLYSSSAGEVRSLNKSLCPNSLQSLTWKFGLIPIFCCSSARVKVLVQFGKVLGQSGSLRLLKTQRERVVANFSFIFGLWGRKDVVDRWLLKKFCDSSPFSLKVSPDIL